jgi:hypothetical protein
MIILMGLSSMLYAQKDTVYVQGLIESGNYGTLNTAIQDVKDDSGQDINNTVFKLTRADWYVLSGTIFMDVNENLEIVADKPGNTQETAPPLIVWTEEALGGGEGVNSDYIIQTYSDLVLKNLWIRHANILGTQLGTSITFEDTTEVNPRDYGYFEGVIFDWGGIGSEGSGIVSVKAGNFVGIFKDCYFRNGSDDHFQYYGRAVSFPYQSSAFHYDSLLFENCTFTNIGRLVMQEGNEYGDNIHINHCTIYTTVEWVFQSAGWLRNASITNSIFVNPYIMGYRAVDVCDEDQDYDDFEDGLCDPPGGGLINGITEVDSFGFVVPFTDYDRKLFIGNNVYMYQDWMLDWYTECTWCETQIINRDEDLLRNPAPMLGENEIAFIDSVDDEGAKVFQNLNVDWPTIFTDDPEFIVQPLNEDSLKLFIEGRWGTGLDIDWAYAMNFGLNGIWPLPENLAFNNTAYQTAAMGGFPLGDLNWYPDQKAAWEAQRGNEWTTINNWLDYGNPEGPNSVEEISGVTPGEYVLKQNYPNPFNPTTNIEYSIPFSGFVSLKIYNSAGQEVTTLMSDFQNAGTYKATFNGSNLASGVYVYKLHAGNVTITKKLVLIK